MVIHTEEQIKSATKNLPNLSTDELAHCYKCASATKSKVYQNYMSAIEKELNSRKKHKEPEECNE